MPSRKSSLPPPPTKSEFTLSERITLRGLRRDNAVSRLLQNVPRPRRAVPENAPEEWHYLPLDQMMPMFKWPADSSIAFSRNKCGREIFASKGADFDLSDPYCRTVSYEYQPMHDHHLQRLYKMQPNLKKLLHRRGMITTDEDVICTVREFNEYRQFLKRLYTMKINRVRAQDDEEKMDQIRFSKAEKMAQKNAELYARHEHVLENRRKYREAMKMQIINAAARQKVLMAKYNATVARFELLKEAKRQDLRDRMHDKEQHALERRNQMALLEKRRVILMHRKFALENGLVKQRMRLIRLRKARLCNEEIQCNWDAHTEFRLHCRMRDEQLMALEQELRAYQVMLRNRSVQKSFERDQQNILLTRAKLVLARYPGRTKEDLVQIMISEVQRLVRQQFAEEVELAKSNSEHVDEIELRNQRNPNNMIRPVSKRNSIKLMPIQSKTSVHSEVAIDSAPSHIFKTIPYEPRHLTSVGLIDNVKGYGKLTEADIRKAVESSYDTMIGLNQKISAQLVFEEAKVILLRISKGYANDIPRDDAVVECVRNRVRIMLDEIQQQFIDRLLAAHAERFESNDTNSTDTGNMAKPPREISLEFGEAKAIATSVYSPPIGGVKSSKSRKPTPATSVRLVARNILTEEPLTPTDDHRLNDADMQDRSIAHLYDFQKVMILDNLERFKEKLKEKLAASLRKAIDFNTCELKDSDALLVQDLTKEEMDALTTQITDTALSLPEKDSEFGNRVLYTADTLTPPILSKIQKNLDEIHEANSKQKNNNNKNDNESQDGGCCGCLGPKSKK